MQRTESICSVAALNYITVNFFDGNQQNTSKIDSSSMKLSGNVVAS